MVKVTGVPLKNLLIITVASLMAVACYTRARQNRYAKLFGEVIDRVAVDYVEPVERRELFENALNGMLSDLDPYSAYINPDKFSEFNETLNQKFGGIGIIVEINEETDMITVLSPVVGTPAYRAGIRSGDTILAVDGTNVEGYRLEEAVKLLRGDPKTKVHVRIRHQGETETVEFTITRDVIQVPSVLGDQRGADGSWDFVLEQNPLIAYLRISTFGDLTLEELESALEVVKEKDIEGLILDLRNNAGGLLSAAVATCDLFLDEGIIVTTRGRGGQVLSPEKASSKTTIVDKDISIVVLVNKYSASASEIVAACLQDHDRAVIIGERTWGKGTVQKLFPLEMEKSALKLTTATYWRPSGQNIHRPKENADSDVWGVLPDEGYEVALSEEEFGKLVQQRQKRDRDQFVGNESGDGDPDEPGANGDDGNSAEGEDPEDPDESGSVEDLQTDTFEDRQLNKAIEYIEQQIAGRSAVTAEVSYKIFNQIENFSTGAAFQHLASVPKQVFAMHSQAPPIETMLGKSR